MKKDPEIYLGHILEAIRDIQAYMDGKNWKSFARDRMMQDAIVRKLEIIGEASTRLPQGLKETHPEIPWHSIVGMRNALIHDYGGVILDVVWDTVHGNLPRLESAVQEMLKELP